MVGDRAMIFPPPSLESLVSTMRAHGNASPKIDFERLAIGQQGRWPADRIRAEFEKQEARDSLTPSKPVDDE